MESNEFEDRIKQIKSKLLNLERVGIDTQEYKIRLGNIEVECNINYIDKNNSNASSCQVEFKANENLNEYLSHLESELSKYDLIISLYNYCKSIDLDVLKIYKKAIISKDGLDINEIQDYIKKIQDYLINLYNDKNNKISDKLLSSIYEIVYYLIKIEIILTNKSTLYDFINEKHIDTRYINALICNDVNATNEIKNDDSKKTLIKKRLDALIPKLNKDSSNYNYFNIEIIKLILMLQSNYDAYKELEKDFNEKFESSIEQDNSFDDLDDRMRREASNLLFRKSILKDSKGFIFKGSILPLILSLSVFITIGNLARKDIKKSNTKNIYNKTTEIYSTLNDDSIIREEDFLSRLSCPSEQHLKIYGLWQDNNDGTFSRYVREYDLPKENRYEIDDLDNIDIDNIDVEFDEYIETISSSQMADTQTYDESIKELYNTDYQYKDSEFNQKHFRTDMIIFYTFYISLLLFFEYLAFLRPLKESLYEIDSINGEIIYSKDVLEENLNKFMAYVNSNNELLQEFNKLYQENIDLLQDEEELKERLADIIDNFKENNEHINYTLNRTNESLNS